MDINKTNTRNGSSKEEWDNYNARMVAQAKGLKLHSDWDCAPLKAAYVGDVGSVWIPDPNTPEIQNILKRSGSKEQLDFLDKHKGKKLEDVDPETFETLKNETDALAKAIKDSGAAVIQTGKDIPFELASFQDSWGGPRWLSMQGHAGFDVVGDMLIAGWEVGPNRAQELAARPAINEMMKNSPDAVWLTMPPPVPNRHDPVPAPFMSIGDFKVMPDKTLLFGHGIPNKAAIKDRSVNRTSGDEYGAEILRRMVEPYGWKVENIYYDSQYTYHLDALMMLAGEGVMGLPDVPNGGLLSELPERYQDWDIIKVPVEEQGMGACNTVATRDEGILVFEDCPKTSELLAKRGFNPIPVPFRLNYAITGSGLHCSCTCFWREA